MPDDGADGVAAAELELDEDERQLDDELLELLDLLELELDLDEDDELDDDDDAASEDDEDSRGCNTSKSPDARSSWQASSIAW